MTDFVQLIAICNFIITNLPQIIEFIKIIIIIIKIYKKKKKNKRKKK